GARSELHAILSGGCDCLQPEQVAESQGQGSLLRRKLYGRRFGARGRAGAQYKVVAEHGLEYERLEKDVEVKEGQTADISFQLHPWIRMRERGWYSGDMHVHRTPQESPALAYAEDLNVLVVYTMWNKTNLWKESGPPAEPIVKVSPNHYLLLMDVED